MRVLVLTRVYPNGARPTYGVFVRERVRRIAQRCALQVVAPIARFPGDAALGRGRRQSVPGREWQGNVLVHHPVVLSIPVVAKSLDALFYCLSLLPFLRRLRREFAFDMIDAHFGYPDGVAALLLGGWLRCPVTVTLRGNEVLLVRSRLRRWQLQLALRRASRVIAVSHALGALASRLGAPAERICVIPNGIDPHTFRRGDRNAARTRLGLPADRAIVVSVGAFTAVKGHERTLASLPHVIALQPRLLYVAIGNSGAPHSRIPAIRRLVRRLGLTDNVLLREARPHEEIPAWLQAADVFCLATAGEGHSNALCEALACGLPIVTTQLDGNREMVRDGVNGYLVPFFDAAAFAAAIARALERAWDRDAIAAQAAARTWEQVADEVMHAFRGALADTQPGVQG